MQRHLVLAKRASLHVRQVFWLTTRYEIAILNNCRHINYILLCLISLLKICDRIKNDGWEVIQDEQGRMGPYARKGTQWVSFDDPAMIRKKSQLVRALNLGGGMVWALDLDDFRNRCGEGVHPLLTQIHDVLKDPPKDYEELRKFAPIRI